MLWTAIANLFPLGFSSLYPLCVSFTSIIYSDTNPLKVVNLVGSDKVDNDRNWKLLHESERTSRVTARLSFLQQNKDDVKKISSIYNYTKCLAYNKSPVIRKDVLLVDFRKPSGVKLALEAIRFVTTSSYSRIAFLFNSESGNNFSNLYIFALTIVVDPATMSEKEFSEHFVLEESIAKAGSHLGIFKGCAEILINIGIDVITSLLEAQQSALESGAPLTRYA